jgi:hypothetical protein
VNCCRPLSLASLIVHHIGKASQGSPPFANRLAGGREGSEQLARDFGEVITDVQCELPWASRLLLTALEFPRVKGCAVAANKGYPEAGRRTPSASMGPAVTFQLIQQRFRRLPPV